MVIHFAAPEAYQGVMLPWIQINIGILGSPDHYNLQTQKEEDAFLALQNAIPFAGIFLGGALLFIFGSKMNKSWTIFGTKMVTLGAFLVMFIEN